MKINLDGFNTQSAPMDAIEEIVRDVDEGFVNPLVAINYIRSVCIEWRQ